MRFKQFFVLRENPDNANFIIGSRKAEKWFHSDASRTIIMDDSILVHAPTLDGEKQNYHSYMHGDLSKWVNDTGADISEFPFEYIGTPSQNFIAVHRYDGTNVGGSPLVDARSWIINDDTVSDPSMGISFWNTARDITPKMIELIERYASLYDVDPLDIYYEIGNTTFVEDQLKYIIGSIKSDTPSTKIVRDVPDHLLPPEKKRAALLAKGAKPKAPIPLQQKIQRDGD